MNLKDLKQYETYFYRAPSAHNTQPWALTYGQETIELGFDEKRALPDGDPTNRDLLLSLGAFVETVLIVASHFKQDLEFIADIDLAKHHIGSFKKSIQSYKTPFTLGDVEKRQTSRLIYKKDRIDPKAVEALRVQSNGLDIHILESTSLIDLFKESDYYVFHHIPVLKELRQWLRLSKSDPRYVKDGLNAECLNLDGVQSFIFNWILKSLEFGYGQRLKLDQLLTMSSLDVLKNRCDVMVLTGKNNGEASVLEAGRSLQRIWLDLARKGYFTHPLSQIIDCPKTYAMLASRMALKDKDQIFSVFRVGSSSLPAHSYRNH